MSTETEGPLPGLDIGLKVLAAWTLTAHEAAELDPDPEWRHLIRTALATGPESAMNLVQGLMSLAQVLLWDDSAGDYSAIRARLELVRQRHC